MKIFDITIVEQNRTHFVVEANNRNEAKELFEAYMENEKTGQEVQYCLEHGYDGYELFVSELDDWNRAPDLTYDELKQPAEQMGV